MVTVAVRHNDEVELSQIDTHSLYVVFKNFGIVARVEEDAFAAIFDQSCKPPNPWSGRDSCQTNRTEW
jgi:hypothetical protein